MRAQALSLALGASFRPEVWLIWYKFPPRGVLNSPLKNEMGDRMMRVFFALAIVITAAIGLGGCFHHNQAVVEAPISHTPLK